MKEVKRNLSKWMYWFILAVCVIFVYKFLDNVSAIGTAIGNFFEVITPFLAGALLAYLLYIPASRIEKIFKKSKSKLLKKTARGTSVLITYILAIVVIILVVVIRLVVIIVYVRTIRQNKRTIGSFVLSRVVISATIKFHIGTRHTIICKICLCRATKRE